MTASINDLPPPYPNQALLRSKENSEVSPQKIVREKAQENRDVAARVAADQVDGETDGFTEAGYDGSGKQQGFSLYV